MAEQTTGVKLSWFHPDYPPLGRDEVGTAAVNGQIVEYPALVRKHVDPAISNQIYGNISFNLFETPKIFKGKNVYGFVKIRGNHESVEVARADASRIVREVDSKFLVAIGPVGVWVPITESISAIKDLYDVKDSDQGISLRDEAIKDKEKEDQKKIQEIKEAEERLVEGGDIYDNQDSLKFYTMKRVTDMTLYETNRAQYLKLRSIQKTLIEQRILLKNLEEKHPEYSTSWVELYNQERKKSGITTFVPGETQFEEYESLSLDDLHKLLDIANKDTNTSPSQYLFSLLEKQKAETANGSVTATVSASVGDLDLDLVVANEIIPKSTSTKI